MVRVRGQGQLSCPNGYGGNFQCPNGSGLTSTSGSEVRGNFRVSKVRGKFPCPSGSSLTFKSTASGAALVSQRAKGNVCIPGQLWWAVTHQHPPCDPSTQTLVIGSSLTRHVQCGRCHYAPTNDGLQSGLTSPGQCYIGSPNGRTVVNK